MRESTGLLGAALLAIALVVASAHAQTARPFPCTPEGVVTDANQLRVVRSCLAGTTEYFTTTRTEAAGRISVIVYGLAKYLRTYEKQPKKDPQLDPSQLILYVDGLPLNKLYGRLPDPAHSHLVFDFGALAREPGNTDSRSWKTLLSDGIRDRSMTLSVGFQGRGPIASDIDDFTIDAISWPWLIVWWVFCGGLLALLVWAARASDMLRVPGDAPKKLASETNQPRKAYSLARTQMAAWFFTVLVGYVFIYLVTGALDTISSTVLGMMGISAATGFAATVVDMKPGGTVAERTQGIVLDLVRENSGMSLPRLQILVWLLVLIGIFARTIYDTLAMPDFNATLLGLMGISGGTYVGFKMPDKNAEK